MVRRAVAAAAAGREGLTGVVFGGTETDMGIAKEGLGVAGRMRLFLDKEKPAKLISDIAEEVLVAAAGAFVAELAFTVVRAGFFLHGILP